LAGGQIKRRHHRTFDQRLLDFDPIDSCTYLKTDDTVDRAREVFAKDLGKRLFSALVTVNGRPNETPINIVTPWDFVTGKFL
jgi:hypothetical protein